MLTVKHVGDTGNETIYPATEVSYNPNIGSGSVGGDPNIKHVQSIGCVWYTDPRSSEIKSLEGGTVYVMNETGKTIATYRMAPEPFGQIGGETLDRFSGPATAADKVWRG